MLDKKQFISIVKYLIMFMCVFTLSHVITNGTQDITKCMYIALGASTIFVTLDYVSPICVSKLEGNITVNTCDHKL